MQSHLESGEALEKFRENIECQNGDPKVCDEPESLFDKNLIKFEIKANESGFVSEIDTLAIGNAIVRIGGGRTKAEDAIDHAVGFACERKIGDEVKENEILGILYSRGRNQAHQISEKLRNAYKINKEKPQKLELIKEVVN